MNDLTRRDFLKLGLFTVGSLAFRPWPEWIDMQSDIPDAEKMGRVCVGKMDLRSKPSVDAPSLGVLYEDSVVIWLREVVGETPGLALSRRWVETPNGYLYAPSVQPVRNQPNKPLTALPDSTMGKGLWVEVTLPYIDIFLDNPPGRAPWLKDKQNPRLFYSQIMSIDDIRADSNGKIFYRVNEKYGTYGDIFWAPGEAFRPLTKDELEPINPGNPDKRVVVDITHQQLSCFEGNKEVYFCRISSGAMFDYEGKAVEEWATPVGDHTIWRKVLSIHMAGGTATGGYDLPGIPWTSLFKGDGVAIHSTFWHNDYGTPRSHGCVNASPEDAKWIFRWTEPHVPYDPGDITIQGMGKSSKVLVTQAS